MWHRLILALMLISLSGCSTFRPDRWYLHNPVNRELADQAKSNWTPVQANLWQNLLKNQQLTSDAELQAQRLLQQAVVSSHHIEMVNMTWSEMLQAATDHRKNLEEQRDDIKMEKDKALEDSTAVGKEIEALIKETQTRQNALKRAQLDQQHWQDELLIFEKATKDFLLQQATKPTNSQGFLEDIQKQTIDNLGKDGLSKVLPGDGIADAPPGITFEILSLGADLAKAQLDRDKAIEERLEGEIKIFSRREDEIEEALKWFGEAIREIGSGNFKSELNNTVLASIQKSVRNGSTPDTEGLILTLQNYVLADDLYTLSDNTFEISKSALLHRYAIKDSAIAVKEHEALIQRGLETLAVYHAGGITQEEINSILQAAQAVALGVISAGVM